MKRRSILTILMAILFITPTLVMAAGLVQVVPPDCDQKGGCSSICDLAQLAQNVLNDGIYLSIFLSAALFAWAGWMHMSAGGDTGKIKQANEVFTNVFIGLIIILAAWLIVDTLMRTIAGGTPGPPWNQIC